MTLHLLDLRPINSLSPDDKANLAVSIAHLPDGPKVVVSRYSDEVWDFYPYIPQENLPPCSKQLDWRIELTDGRRLTDADHSALLESAKDFIWSLFTDPVEGRKRPMMMTLRNKTDALTPLLRWMVGQKFSRFADLAGHTLDYVPYASLTKRGAKVGAQTLSNRLLIVEDIYRQRHKVSDALQVYPWPHETACTLAGFKQGGTNNKPKTEFIPNAVASRLISVALDYIQNRSPKILDALGASRVAKEEKRVAGFGRTAQRQAGYAAARDAGFEDATNLGSDRIRLRTACYIIIDMFSGLRDSEMMSIAENCIVPGRSRDGSTEILWLHGTIYKTGMRPKRWMVPPVVENAVRVLTLLTESMREQLRHEEWEIGERIGLSIGKGKTQLVKRLDNVRKQKDRLFLTTRSGVVSVVSGAAMREALRRLCADHGIRGEDGQPYPLHAHQFRRTYARFMARVELGDMLTLRDHFGHWSIDMATYYADGGAGEYEADTELLEMVAAEKQSRQIEIMGEYLDSDKPLANGGHWLNDWRSSVRTAASKEELIAEYAGTITLNGTGHSWCVGNAKGNGCGGLCVFEAQMCVDCNSGIIGQEHRPVWEGIRDQQQEALALDDMGPGGRARAKQILEYADKVLRRLDGQEML